jgi:mono/diheme cytochrome c family protein
MRTFALILALSLACAILGVGKVARADEEIELVAARLEHKLAYLEADYSMAASSGAPSDEGESEEHVALAAELERTVGRLSLGPDDATRVLSVAALVRRSAPASEVGAAVEDARRILVADFHLAVAPAAAPDAAHGRAIFEQYCSSCHATTGRADTERAASLKPHPANFLDPNVGEPLSPYRVSTTVRFGVDGTPMVPFGLSESDRWDVAFYVMGLRHVAPPIDGPGFSLADLATRSDAELRSSVRAAGVGEARVEGVITGLRQRAPYARPAARSRWGGLGGFAVICLAYALARACRRSDAGGRLSRRALFAAAGLVVGLLCAAASTRAGAAPSSLPTDRVFEKNRSDAERIPGSAVPSATATPGSPVVMDLSVPCASPGYGPGPEPPFAGNIPFTVVFNCLWPSHARMEVSVALTRPAKRSEVELLLRELWTGLRAKMGKDFPETAKVCVLPKGATLRDSPLGCIKDGYEPEGEPGEEEADLTVDVAAEPSEIAQALGRAIHAPPSRATAHVTYERARSEVLVTYAFSEGEGSTPRFTDVVLPLFVAAWDFYPPKTAVTTLAFQATARGRSLVRVRIAHLEAFLAMHPWALRQRLDDAHVPLELAAHRTAEQDASLRRELEAALARLPPGSVVLDPTLEQRP